MNTHIDRHDLLALLDKGLNYPLVLMIAPAGSGKSILLDQWQAHRKRDASDSHILHFQLSPRFNEGHTLFAAIFEKLKAVASLWDASFFNLFKDDSEVKPEQIIDVFIEAFAQVDQAITIIFDDFHLIKTSDIHKTMEELIARLPTHVNFVISSRAHPQFSIAKLKLQESVLMIDSHDLKLDEQSLLALNHTIGASNIESERASRLLIQTEGWFVGTKLALLAYDKTGNIALDNFSGSQPELLNYFGHEVLNKLRPSLRRFVLGTAITQAFNQDLCEHVLNIDYTAAKLEEITMQELFLSPVPNLPGWYRYHPLLQDFLLKRLEIEESPAYIQHLHFRVAQYFLEKHNHSKAIYHASLCSQQSFYFNVLENACHAWIRQGELEPVIESLSTLSNEDFNQHPELLINQLYALLFTRRFNQAGFFVELLASSEENCERQSAHFHFFNLLLSILQSDTEVLTPEQKNFQALSAAPPEALGFVKVVQAYSLMCNGHLKEAFKIASQAKLDLRQLEHPFFESFANLIIILCDRYLGRGIDAVQLMNEVFLPIENGNRNPLWANLATGMLVVEYEQNRLNNFLELSSQLTPLLNHSCATEQVATVYLYSARVFHIEGQRSKACRLLDQLERILSLGDYQRLNSQVVHEKMRQAFINGDLSLCEHLFEHYHLADFSKKGVWQTSEHYEERTEKLALSAVYYHIAKAKFKLASELLEDLARQLDRHGLVSRALVARCNIAMLAFKQGKSDIATSQLKRLISRYGLVCFSRSVFDEAPSLEQLFQHAMHENRVMLPTLFINIFSTLLNAEENPASQIQPAHLLTDKELEVFELLAAGLSNPEISEQLSIAVSTTKWHLKNIYTKLGVKNRTAALALAHKTVAA